MTDPQNSCIVAFDSSNGEHHEPTLLHSASDSDSSHSITSSGSSDHQIADWTPAERIRLDSSQELAALSYRNAAVTVWDLAIGQPIGTFEKDGCVDVYSSVQAIDMIFNPMAELDLLAVSYKDGDIATCNPWTCETVNTREHQVYLDALAATSEGRILAGAAEDGGIHLFLFETLQPVYRISRPDTQLRIQDIAFSTDNLRFLDVRGQSCNVWEPQILVPRDVSDDTSSEPQSEEFAISEAPITQAHVFEWEESITIIEHTADGKTLFVGRQDGSIDVCNAASCRTVDKLKLHHSFAEIVHLKWNEKKSCLLSVDSTGRCMVHRIIDFTAKSGLVSVKKLFDYRQCFHAVHQVLIGPEACSILVSTASSTKLITYSGEGGSVAAEICLQGRSSWAQHPTSPSRLIAIQDGEVRLFDWNSLERLPLPATISFASAVAGNRIDSAQQSFDIWSRSQTSSHLIINPQCSSSQHKFDNIFALDASKLDNNTEASFQVLGPSFVHLSIERVLGCLRSSLYYLDSGGWVCSVSLKNAKELKHYTRHFFIPSTWRTGSDPVIKLISKTSLALGRGEQLFVFHGFLEFEEKISLFS